MSEDLIWDSITESAKSRFDYRGFSQPLVGAGLPENFPDNMVFQTICHLVEKKPLGQIKAELKMNLMMSGFDLDDTALDDFIENKENELSKEIYVTDTAFQMLQDGSDPMQVLLFVKNFLK